MLCDPWACGGLSLGLIPTFSNEGAEELIRGSFLLKHYVFHEIHGDVAMVKSERCYTSLERDSLLKEKVLPQHGVGFRGDLP